MGQYGNNHWPRTNYHYVHVRHNRCSIIYSCCITSIHVHTYTFVPILSHLLVGGNQTGHLLPSFIHLEQVLNKRKKYTHTLNHYCILHELNREAYWEVDTVREELVSWMHQILGLGHTYTSFNRWRQANVYRVLCVSMAILCTRTRFIGS